MQKVGLKVQAPIKKTTTLLWNGNKPGKQIKMEILKWIYSKIIKWP